MMVQVKCPLCHKRLMDAEEVVVKGTKVTAAQQGESGDYQVKCNFCKNKINIRKQTDS